jgi:hypothetical protein
MGRKQLKKEFDNLYPLPGFNKTITLNSVASVRERTIPTERLLLVGKVIANF